MCVVDCRSVCSYNFILLLYNFLISFLLVNLLINLFSFSSLCKVYLFPPHAYPYLAKLLQIFHIKPIPIEFQSFSLSLCHAMGVHGQWDDLHQCDALWVLLIKM